MTRVFSRFCIWDGLCLMKGLLNVWYLKRLKKHWCWCYKLILKMVWKQIFLIFYPQIAVFFKIFVFIWMLDIYEVSAYGMKAICLCLQNTDAFVHKARFYGEMFAFECLLFSEIWTDALQVFLIVLGRVPDIILPSNIQSIQQSRNSHLWLTTQMHHYRSTS